MGRLLSRKPVYVHRHSYVSTNVTTGAWVELIAETTVASSGLEVFDSGGRVMKLAYGAPGSEVEFPYHIPPGGSEELFPIEIPAGVRLAIRAVDSNATVGQLILNFFGG